MHRKGVGAGAGAGASVSSFAMVGAVTVTEPEADKYPITTYNKVYLKMPLTMHY
jgi:hypothetical protein